MNGQLGRATPAAAMVALGLPAVLATTAVVGGDGPCEQKLPRSGYGCADAVISKVRSVDL